MSYTNADYRLQSVHQWADELLEFTNVDPDVALQEALIVQAEIDDELNAYHMELCMDEPMHIHDPQNSGLEEYLSMRGENLAIKKLYDERIFPAHDVECVPVDITNELPF